MSTTTPPPCCADQPAQDAGTINAELFKCAYFKRVNKRINVEVFKAPDGEMVIHTHIRKLTGHPKDRNIQTASMTLTYESFRILAEAYNFILQDKEFFDLTTKAEEEISKAEWCCRTNMAHAYRQLTK